VTVPVLVTVIIRGKPELGVPLTPYSVRPVTLRARALTLVESVVAFVEQVTVMLVMFAEPTVPLPFVITQLWSMGCVRIVTL